MLDRSSKASFDAPQAEHSGNLARKVWALHHSRSRKAIVRVVPDADSPLYCVLWSDIGLSPPANLTRCKDAAREWAERSAVTEHRKLSVAQRLKSLDNFSWSSSPMRFPSELGWRGGSVRERLPTRTGLSVLSWHCRLSQIGRAKVKSEKPKPAPQSAAAGAPFDEAQP